MTPERFFRLTLFKAAITTLTVASHPQEKLLQLQFLDIREAINSFNKGYNITLDQPERKEWYKSTVLRNEDAKSLWKKVYPANEVPITDGQHAFSQVNVFFPIRLFGQSLNRVLITSAGGILTSQTVNRSKVELPNHIAPFLCSFPPDRKNDEVCYSERGNVFLVQWTRHIGHDQQLLAKIGFQAQIYPNGTLVFVYRDFNAEGIRFVIKSGFPYVIGVQNGFCTVNSETSDDLVAHVPPSKLFFLKDVATSRDAAIILDPLVKDNPERTDDDEEDEYISLNRYEVPDKRCDAAVCSTKGGDLVCGSNDITYANKCEFDRASCNNPGLFELHDGECEAKGVRGCEKFCPTESLDPVCGNNSKTYRNECAFEIAACKNSEPLSMAHKGPCGEKAFEIPKGQGHVDCTSACSTDDNEPVCGSDGVTYKNKCFLKVVGCHNNHSAITFQSNGQCRSESGTPYTGTRGFRLVFTCGVGAVIVSTVALIVIVVSKNQSATRTATVDVDFMRMSENEYTDDSIQVEMEQMYKNGMVKYKRLG